MKNNTFLTRAQYLTIFIISAIVVFAAAVVVVIGIEHAAIVALTGGWPLFFNVITPATIMSLTILVVTLPNLVHSLFALIGVFLCTALLYIGVGAEYLAFVFIIVYVGAISILFLFVIMLINIRNVAAPYRELPAARKLATIAIIGFSILLVFRFAELLDAFTVLTNYAQLSAEPSNGDFVTQYITTRFLDVLIFGERLYTEFNYLFFLITLLLLTAMLGAIILATTTTEKMAERPMDVASLSCKTENK